MGRKAKRLKQKQRGDKTGEKMVAKLRSELVTKPQPPQQVNSRGRT
jgi:hypothetical protein